ncbi:MAG: hypothetical protein ACYCUW_03330 [bacterium]
MKIAKRKKIALIVEGEDDNKFYTALFEKKYPDLGIITKITNGRKNIEQKKKLRGYIKLIKSQDDIEKIVVILDSDGRKVDEVKKNIILIVKDFYNKNSNEEPLKFGSKIVVINKELESIILENIDVLNSYMRCKNKEIKKPKSKNKEGFYNILNKYGKMVTPNTYKELAEEFNFDLKIEKYDKYF